MSPVVRLCAGIRRRFREETGLPGDEFWEVAAWYAAHDYLVDKDELREECGASESDFENLCTAFTMPPGRNPLPSFWPSVLLDGRPAPKTQLDWVRVTYQFGWEDGNVSMIRGEVPVLPDESCPDWTDGLLSRALRVVTAELLKEVDEIGMPRLHDDLSVSYGTREDYELFKQRLAVLSGGAASGEAPARFAELAAAAAELCRPYAGTPVYNADYVTRVRARLRRSRAERRAEGSVPGAADEPSGMLEHARRIAERVRVLNEPEQAGALIALASSNAMLHALVRKELARPTGVEPV